MKTKFLAMLLMSVMALSACTPAPTPTPTPSTDSDMETEMEEEVVESAGIVLEDFSQEAYDAAIAEGKDVMLEFFASWCPTCIANGPELEAALAASGNANLVAFKVDYDNSEDLQTQFEVLSQSSYILISGGDVDDFELLGPGLLKEADFSGFLQ